MASSSSPHLSAEAAAQLDQAVKELYAFKKEMQTLNQDLKKQQKPERGTSDQEKRLSSATKYLEHKKMYQCQITFEKAKITLYCRDFDNALKADELVQNIQKLSPQSRKRKKEDKHAKLNALKEKRSNNIAIYGNNSNKERIVALALCETWQDVHQQKAIVLNDGTRADILLWVSEDIFLPLQLKTANCLANNPNQWQFNHTKGYGDMPVVCWRIDQEDGILYDGNQLAESTSLSFTPGGKNDHGLAIESKLTMKDLVKLLMEKHDIWSSTNYNEDEARNDLLSKNHKLEKKGIDIYKKFFPMSQFEWPQGQNTHVDLMQDSKRLQFKTAQPNESSYGFHCDVHTCAGTDENGKQLKMPYPEGSFDYLVAVTFDTNDDDAHYWIIPAERLVDADIMSTQLKNGKESFTLAIPRDVDLGRHPAKENYVPADWTRKYYCGTDPSAQFA